MASLALSTPLSPPRRAWLRKPLAVLALAAALAAGVGGSHFMTGIAAEQREEIALLTDERGATEKLIATAEQHNGLAAAKVAELRGAILELEAALTGTEGFIQ